MRTLTKTLAWLALCALMAPQAFALEDSAQLTSRPALPEMPAATANDCVILLHGLRRSAWAMGKLEKALLNSGYQVFNEDYPSTEYPIEELAATTIPRALDYCRAQSVQRIHFVTHSMGGILVRNYLQNNGIDELGRIVMIAPPNRGSEIVDTIGHWALFGKLMGPAGLQLGTGETGITASLLPIPGEIGIVAGERTIDPWLSWMIPGKDDGKVSLVSAILPEMKDFLVVPASHPTIMRKRRVIEQVQAFLQQGTFIHES